MSDLKRRGLQAPKMVIGDGHLGIWGALAAVFPEPAEQRCWNHRILNVLDKLPFKRQAEARSLLTKIPYADTREEAERQKRAFQAWFAKGGRAGAQPSNRKCGLNPLEVQHEDVRRKLGDSGRALGEASRLVEGVPGDQADSCAVLVGEDPPPVLLLVDPAVTMERWAGQGRSHRDERAGHDKHRPSSCRTGQGGCAA